MNDIRSQVIYRFLKNLLFISTDNTGLNVIGIISLNFATALSGNNLHKSKAIKLWSDRTGCMEVLLNVQFRHRTII